MTRRTNWISISKKHILTRMAILNPEARKRLLKDIQNMKENLPEGIWLHVDDSDISQLKVTLLGPEGTPYHDGYFTFRLTIPDDYPARPPGLHYQTESTVAYEISPLIDPIGGLCLAVLNWTPDTTLMGFVQSFQFAILNSTPYSMDEGVELTDDQKQQTDYANELVNYVLQKEVMEYAVISFMRNLLTRTPATETEIQIMTSFLENSEHLKGKMKPTTDVILLMVEPNYNELLTTLGKDLAQVQADVTKKLEEISAAAAAGNDDAEGTDANPEKKSKTN